MGVGGYNQVLLALGHAEEGPLQFQQAGIDPVDRPTAVEPQVGRHLIVAAAGGVQLAAGIAQPVGQSRLNMQVNVFLGGGEGELPRGDFLANLLQGFADGIGLGSGEQAAVGQHPRVGDRAVDVIVGQATVKRDAFRKGFDPLVGWHTENAPPGFAAGRGGRG